MTKRVGVAGIILDLDQTLIDTRALAPLRDARQWSLIRSRVSACTPAPGVAEFVSYAQRTGIKLAIATSSPGAYAASLCTFLGIEINAVVAYHDVTNRKPHPEPILLAARKLGTPLPATWSVGDSPVDILSSKAAGVGRTIGISGLCEDVAALAATQPDEMIENMYDLLRLCKT